MANATILGAIVEHARQRPAGDALIGDDATLSWGGLHAQMQASAAGIAARGVTAGDRVAILAANSSATVVAYLSVVACGGVAVPLPVSLHPKGIAGLLKNCDPKLIIADRKGADMCASIDDLTCELTLPELLHDAGLGIDFPRPADESAPFNIIYSSGTTGQPKGIIHSHAMRDGQAGRATFDLGPASRMLLSTPLYSNTTLMPMLAALFHGGTVRLMSKFDALAYLQIVQDWHATHTMMVPVQYQRIMDCPEFDRFDLGSMTLKQSTSAPFDHALKADVLIRFPGRLIEIYGLTEGGVASMLDTKAHPDKLHTVGRAANHVDLKIIDDRDQELAQGETGEIIGHSPWMMSGYWARADLSEQMKWHHSDGRCFFRSGDLGFVDAEGFLHIVGRKKEMINSGGFNVYPIDLETALMSHPDVSEAAVFAIPSRVWGETPFGVIALKPGANRDADAILDWANKRLGRMQRIDGIEIRSSLPRSSIGKIAKTELAAQYKGMATT